MLAPLANQNSSSGGGGVYLCRQAKRLIHSHWWTGYFALGERVRMEGKNEVGETESYIQNVPRKQIHARSMYTIHAICTSHYMHMKFTKTQTVLQASFSNSLNNYLN